MRRVNESLETYKNLAATRSQLAQKEADAINEKAAVNERFKDQYHSIMDKRNRLESTRTVRMEAARNDALGTVMKAIYITALEAHTLTDNGIMLAESMVDSWIQENGGASRILSKVGNKTYLLSRITQIVEDAALAAVNETEELENDNIPAETKKAAAVAAAKEFLKDADAEGVKDFMAQVLSNSSTETAEESTPEPVSNENPDEEVKLPASDEESKETEQSDETSEENKDSESSKEDDVDPKSDKKENESEENEEVVIDKDEDDDSDPLATTFEDDPDDKDDDEEDDDENDHEEDEDDDDDEEDDDEEDDEDDHEEDSNGDGEVSKEEIEDHTKDELGEPLDNDGVDQDTTIDGGTDNDGKIFDELNKEEDVQKAIEIIRSRIADAEETFIRNNAEDKKKIDELLNKISTNVKTVEDLSDKDETKAKIAEESVRMYKRHIDSIKENRPMTVFEKMSRNLSRNIIKDEVVRESYITESGTLDTDLIVESSKVMYGFLETVNTLQLEKVDISYIKKVLDSMNK